jgi:hypothetical protein
LHPTDRDIYRKKVSDRIKSLHTDEVHRHKKQAQREVNIANSIRSKLRRNNTTIVRADKGNSLVAIPSRQYEEKIQKFIDGNNFHISNRKPTKSF